MNKKDRILDINNRITELDNELDSADIERIDAIGQEVKDLVSERGKLTQDIALEARNAFSKGVKGQRPTAIEDDTEERVRVLKQGRALSVDGTDMLSIEHQSSTMNLAFNEVSNLVDRLGIQSLIGGESFRKAYMKGYDVAGYTAEGLDYHEVEPSWDYAEINKAKITAYTEISEEFEKLAPAMYLQEVKKNLSVSLKKKLALEVLKGDGASNHLTGIFSAANAKAIETATDGEIETINENTLDDIIYAYGGEEDFSPGVLILSKADLREFAKVRGTQDKRKVYTIDKVNQTIDGIPYIINSAITPLQNASAGDYVMAYGSLTNYMLVSFSPVEVMKSYDYKFKQGQIAFKASGFFGGNVVGFNGFLRLKKKVVGT
jgi:HK97 family phage major capsid protein